MVTLREKYSNLSIPDYPLSKKLDKSYNILINYFHVMIVWAAKRGNVTGATWHLLTRPTLCFTKISQNTTYVRSKW